METKKDWILENIKDIMKEKSIKVETVSTEIGISKGEFSKILSGEREQYYKHLPLIAQSLGVSFHSLVTPKGLVQNNHGEVKENSVGNASNTQIHHHGNKDLYERMFAVCEDRNVANQKIIELQKIEINKLNSEIKKLRQKQKE